MKLTKISIFKFRSIEKAKICVGRITAVVGENNAGKSAILKALDVFFHYEKDHFIRGIHDYTKNSQSTIELTFSNIPDEVRGLMKVKDTLSLRLKCKPPEYEPTYEYKFENKWEKCSNNTVEGLFKTINFVLIPPIRDPKEAEIEENTLLKKIVFEYLKRKTENRDNLSSTVREATDLIQKSAFKHIENDLEKLYPLTHKFKFTIDYKNEVDYGLLIDNIALRITEDSPITSFQLKECGTGLQSLTIIALYLYYTKLIYRNAILGIEEPETNLHPQAQREFVRKLNDYAEKSDTQVIFTTHSSVVANELDHKSIVQARRENEERRGFKTVFNQVGPKASASKHIGSEKYYTFYRRRNSEFFFSKSVIILEGEADVEAVRCIAKRNRIDLEQSGIALITLNGVDSVLYPYYLLKELHIPFILVTDKDFFLDYIESEKDSSRDSNGFYKYSKKSLNQTRLKTQLKGIFKSEKERAELLQHLKKGHSSLLKFLTQYSIVCMKYNLEMDLISTKSGKQAYCDVLGLNYNVDNKEILTKYKSKIKSPEKVSAVFERLTNKKLPLSLMAIEKFMKTFIENGK